MHTSEFFEQTTIQDPWSEVPAEDWNNWKWQLKNRITSLEQLESLLELSPEEREGCLLANKKLSLAITPYFFQFNQSFRSSRPNPTTSHSTS